MWYDCLLVGCPLSVVDDGEWFIVKDVEAEAITLDDQP
jgi:hypothetical protein